MLLAQATCPPLCPTAATNGINVAAGWIILIFIALLGAAVIWKIYTGDIDLSRLISEPNGDASMSRFQLLIFTFVIAVSLFLIIVGTTPPMFPSTIPQGILILLGISGSSYLVSKGIQFSSPEGVADRDPAVVISPTAANSVAGGAGIQFSAQVIRETDQSVTWSINPAAGMGTVNASGLYTPPALPTDGTARPTGQVSLTATSNADNTLTDVAVVTLS